MEYVYNGVKTDEGYLKFYTKKRWFQVHRIVAKLFISNPNNFPIPNHIDGIKSNNKVCNLEWTSNKGNCEHSYKLGLSKGSCGSR